MRLIDFVYHSTLGLRVIKKKRQKTDRAREEVEEVSGEEERLEPREPDPRRRWNARLHRVERLL